MQKKFFLLTATALLISTHFFAQDAVVKKDTSYWKKTKQFGININEGGVNNNYSAGGQNSIGINLFFNAKAEYAKEKTTWVNDFQAQYGTINTFGAGGTGTRKGIDRIFFDSKVGRKLSTTWSLVGGFNFQTQFDNGYKYGGKADGSNLLISNFFAPAFMTEYIGLEWKPKPYFNIVFAPGALRQTIVTDDAVYKDAKGVMQAEKYGVAFGKNVLNEVGIMQIVASYDRDIAKNVNLKARYYMFLNANRIEHIDNRLDIKMAAKINKYFSATADLIVLYFDNQSTEIQTAHNLGLGILYTF
jgi:hypothetical protein